MTWLDFFHSLNDEELDLFSDGEGPVSVISEVVAKLPEGSTLVQAAQAYERVLREEVHRIQNDPWLSHVAIAATAPDSPTSP